MIVLGIAVAVVAVLALRNPNNSGSATGSFTSASTASAPAPSASAHAKSAPAHRSTTSGTSDGSAGRSGSGSSNGSGAAGGSGAVGGPGSDGRSDSGSGTSAKDVPLVVLNNTTTTGLAAQAAQRFESGGWTVTTYGNLTNTIISTCAYYDPSVDGAEAAARALQKQYPTIKRVKEKFPELPPGPVVVVLTPGYSAG